MASGLPCSLTWKPSPLTTKTPQAIAASVHARLLNHSRQKKINFEVVLLRFVLERLLFRLSQSKHAGQFALKGAMLLTTWFDEPHRPTRDLDFLGFGDSDGDRLIAVFREVCVIDAQDGVVFDVDGFHVEQIRELTEYGGVRLRTIARLGSAKLHVVIDVGFGDATAPGLEKVELPVLLDFPAPSLRVYARETVVAEKFEALVSLGLTTSRLKDFYDIWMLSQAYEFDAARLVEAIVGTFERRKTVIPSTLPEALSSAFSDDVSKQRQWAAFSESLAVRPQSLASMQADLASFLMPLAAQALRIQNPGADVQI